MVKFTVEIGGTEYPFIMGYYKRSYILRQQPILITLPKIFSISPQDIIEIKRDGATVVKGRVAMNKLHIAGDGIIMEVRGFDGKRKTHILDAIEAAGATAPETEALNQLADTDMTEGTYSASGLAYDLDFGMGADARIVRFKALEEIAFVSGWEFKEKPDWSTDFKAQCGTNRSTSVIFKRGELLEGWVKGSEYIESDLFKVDKVRVIGKGNNYTNLIYGSDAVGGYAVGDPMITINRKSLITAAACTAAAVALRADLTNTLKWGKISVVDTYEGAAYDVFDTVQVVDGKLLINESMRVAGIEKTFNAMGGETTILEVTNIQHLQTSGERLIGQIRTREADDFARAAQIVTASQSTSANSHSGTGVNAHGGVDVNAHGGTDVNAHGGTDVDNHGGTDANAHGGGAVITVSGHAHTLYYRSGYLVTGWITRYCAASSGGAVTTAFSAPSGSTLDNYVKGTGTVSAGSHAHSFTQPNTHSITQPNNHSVDQPNNHSVDQPNNHSVDQPNNHSVSQPNNHTLTNPYHIH